MSVCMFSTTSTEEIANNLFVNSLNNNGFPGYTVSERIALLVLKPNGGNKLRLLLSKSRDFRSFSSARRGSDRSMSLSIYISSFTHGIAPRYAGVHIRLPD